MGQVLHLSSAGKESAWNAGDPGTIPGSGRSAGEGIGYPLQYSWASLVAQLVKNPPTMWETWVQSLGWEDPLEKGPPGSQASSRGEAKDSALLSSRDAGLLEPPERPQGSPASSSVWREDPLLLLPQYLPASESFPKSQLFA